MKTNKPVIFLIVLLVMLIVSATMFTSIPGGIKLVIRITLSAVFLALWRWFDKKNLTEFKNLSFTFFVLNLAFLIVSAFTTDFWGLDAETAKGFALSKLSDSVIISFVIILSFVLGRNNLKSIYLTKGRLIAGLLTGMAFFCRIRIPGNQQP